MLDVLQSLETKDVLRLLETFGSILGKLLKQIKLYLISGVNRRGSLHIHIIQYYYIYICHVIYIYIERHVNMRFISFNYTAVPRAPDFSRLSRGLAPFSTELRRFPWETPEDGTFLIIRLDYWLIVGGNCQMMDYW